MALTSEISLLQLNIHFTLCPVSRDMQVLKKFIQSLDSICECFRFKLPALYAMHDFSIEALSAAMDGSLGHVFVCVCKGAKSFHVFHLMPDQKLSLYEKIFHIARLAFFISHPRKFTSASAAQASSTTTKTTASVERLLAAKREG
jgi:hypothetical protein